MSKFALGIAAFFLSLACHAEDITRLGGDMTSEFEGRHVLQLPAPNVTEESRRLLMTSGFAPFHTPMKRETGLGPHFVNRACGGCHVENGRGPARFSQSRSGESQMVVKISRPGLNEDGTVIPVEGVGDQLQNHTISSTRQSEARLSWRVVKGRYPDGESYELRRPQLRFRIKGISKRQILHSLRMTPAIIGTGLLEAVPAETIELLADPSDDDSDDVSGRVNYVNNKIDGGKSIGRFGFKASQPSVAQQTAAALLGDMGITNPVFNNTSSDPEMGSDVFLSLVVYQLLAGVPKARNQDKSDVARGFEIFKELGCDKCHQPTLQTGANENPELSNQTIHPFTDILLHDMGYGLADRRQEYESTGFEWRTAPLWGLGFAESVSDVNSLFLHDGRARTIEEAILWHGGEAENIRTEFKNLKKSNRKRLLLFLKSL